MKIGIDNCSSLSGIERFFFSGYRRVEVLGHYPSSFDLNSVKVDNFGTGKHFGIFLFRV